MSAPIESDSRCPTCGTTVPAGARYCPNCGTRLDPSTTGTNRSFEAALGDVLDAPVDEPQPAPPAHPNDLTSPSGWTAMRPDLERQIEHPTESVTDVTAAESGTSGQSPVEPKWTATPGNWNTSSGTWNTPSVEPPVSGQRKRRTLWIIVGILGFIIFCCCAMSFLLFAVSANDTAFQNEISWFAGVITAQAAT